MTSSNFDEFSSRFNAAYDLRLYQQAKGYTNASPDWCEYLLWESQDQNEDLNSAIAVDNFDASDGNIEEF